MVMQSDKSKNRVRTTVEFTPEGLRLKNKYLCFGQRSTLTAGLYLFDELSPAQQQSLVTKVLIDEQDEKDGHKSTRTAAAADEAVAGQREADQQRSPAKRRRRKAPDSAG